MSEFMSLLGIFTGMVSVVGAALWLIAMVTGGAGDDTTLDRATSTSDKPARPMPRVDRGSDEP